MAEEPTASPDSALHEAVTRVGDRWTLLVIDALMAGPLRFGELSDRVGGIAPNVLTTRVRQLERDGLVISTPYSQRPLRLTYELTETGRELAGALSLLESWGRRHTDGHDAAFHATCGTPLEVRLFCPTCDRRVDEPESTDAISV
jgi:DNA-binding HxlR family transcriptional regulator